MAVTLSNHFFALVFCSRILEEKNAAAALPPGLQLHQRLASPPPLLSLQLLIALPHLLPPVCDGDDRPSGYSFGLRRLPLRLATTAPPPLVRVPGFQCQLCFIANPVDLLDSQYWWRMENSSSFEQSLPEKIIQPLISSSNSSTLETSLGALTEASRTSEGRSNLASQNILSIVLKLIQLLPYPSSGGLLMSSLKLLRNLCAGEIRNQNSFLENNGVEVVSSILHSVTLVSNPDGMIIRIGLQVLANVSVAGEEHQRAIWGELFPEKFVSLARIRNRGISDPLCMIIHNLCSRHAELVALLCGDSGFLIIEEITRTAFTVGYGEDCLKLLLLRICLEEPYFPLLFSKLQPVDISDDGVKNGHENVSFSSEQAFLLATVSEILNERIREVTVSKEFALCVFNIFKSFMSITNSLPICKCSLPTGTTAVDVLGYSLTVLRDICAQDGSEQQKDVSEDAVALLLSLGFVDLLLELLSNIEPPSMIKKAIHQAESRDKSNSYSSKPCPYRGFRRDIVSVLANCMYRRKQVQDDIRKKNGIFVLLQQCVTDEDNPFLREWGIWAVRNFLEGNLENQKVVAELEVLGSVDMPEIAELGLKVEVDPQTRCAKLVNAS